MKMKAIIRNTLNFTPSPMILSAEACLAIMTADFTKAVIYYLLEAKSLGGFLE